MRSIALFLNVRKDSQRCPDKMLRPFAGTTLVDICLEKVNRIDIKKYFGAHEEGLIEKAERYDFEIYRRSYESAHSPNDAGKIFEILRHIREDAVVWINPCVPFLRQETIEQAIDTFRNDESIVSLTSVKESHGWFYYENGRPINNLALDISTITSEPVLEVAHAFHIYPRRRMIDGILWSNQPNDPYLCAIDRDEAFDIDHEDEFLVAEKLWVRREGSEATAGRVVGGQAT